MPDGVEVVAGRDRQADSTSLRVARRRVEEREDGRREAFLRRIGDRLLAQDETDEETSVLRSQVEEDAISPLRAQRPSELRTREAPVFIGGRAKESGRDRRMRSGPWVEDAAAGLTRPNLQGRTREGPCGA